MRTTRFVAPLMFALSVCASSGVMAAAPEIPDLTGYAFLRTQVGSPPAAVSVDEAADTLKDYDVILFGEWHDHPGNHSAEMALYRALQARIPKFALSMEMFERDVQPVLDDYMAGKIGEDALREKGRAWGNYAESYRPLVEYAKEKGLAAIAANAPAGIVRCVGQEGPEYLTKLAPAKRAQAAAELHLDASPYRDKFFRFLDEDGSHGPDEKAVDASGRPAASALRGYAAQITRDDTMAESIAQFLQKNPGSKVFHLTGDFHVEGYMGTAERLKLRAPNLKIAVIAPAEVGGVEADAHNGDFAVLLKALPALYANDAEKKAAEDQIRAVIGRARGGSACMS